MATETQHQPFATLFERWHPGADIPDRDTFADTYFDVMSLLSAHLPSLITTSLDQSLQDHEEKVVLSGHLLPEITATVFMGMGDRDGTRTTYIALSSYGLLFTIDITAEHHVAPEGVTPLEPRELYDLWIQMDDPFESLFNYLEHLGQAYLESAPASQDTTAIKKVVQTIEQAFDRYAAG